MSAGRGRGLSAEDRDAFQQDGVVCLRNVLTSGEIEKLRAGVAQQMERLGRSKTGYDFQAFGKQVWDPVRPVETGTADPVPTCRPMEGDPSRPDPAAVFLWLGRRMPSGQPKALFLSMNVPGLGKTEPPGGGAIGSPFRNFRRLPSGHLCPRENFLFERPPPII